VFREGDAAKVLGQESDGGLAGPHVGAASSCLYGTLNAVLDVVLTYPDPARANRMINALRRLRGARLITHLGDQAVWTGSVIVAIRGRWLIQVGASVGRAGSGVSTPDLSMTLAAARIAVARVKPLHA